MSLGSPRLHLRRTTSTNQRARELASTGAPHGTIVTASEQTAGRGRQGRTWVAPAGRAMLMSVVIRDPPRLLPLMAGAAVAGTVGPEAGLKWPNDVLLDGRKVAGILVEGRPMESWAVVGVGVNVALRAEDLPAELREIAGTLGRAPEAIEPVLAELVQRLDGWLGATEDEVLSAVRARDVLAGRAVRWSDGEGVADGIDGDGRLVVRQGATRVCLDAGEVHLLR